jgi:hypothetical protein
MNKRSMRGTRNPKSAVDKFLLSESHVECNTLYAVARAICADDKGLSTAHIEVMKNRLAKAKKGNRLFEYKNGDGNIVFETISARRKRLGHPAGVSGRRMANAGSSNTVSA